MTKWRSLWAKLAVASIAVSLASLVAVSVTVTDSAFHPPRISVEETCPAVPGASCTVAETTPPDGTHLSAWYLEPEHFNGGAVIVLHGIGGSRLEVMNFSRLLMSFGYAVLAPDLRGHGRSGGMTTYGLREAQDVRAWTTWMTARPHVERVYGFGASLGGSVLLESLLVEKRFRAVVAESAYSDFPGIARERMVRMGGAAWGWTGPLVARTAIFYAGEKYGLDWSNASPIAGVRAARIPILLIHGADDDRTSPANSVRMAAANPDMTQLWLIPHGGHANGWATAGVVFEQRLRDWYGSH